METCQFILFLASAIVLPWSAIALMKANMRACALYIASSFTERIDSDMADFNSLLELKLPEIAFFDDVAMAAEFDAITQKLTKE